MLPTSELDFELPASLIATRPAEPRDSSRLMVVRRSGSAPPEHARFRDLPEYLSPGDRLVFNTTRVLPARLQGNRADSGGGVSGLFLRETGADPLHWLVALKSNGRLRPGVEIELRSTDGRMPGPRIVLVEKQGESWLVRLDGVETGETTPGVLARIGATPLPPYILRARAEAHLTIDEQQDRAWYQTVYAGDSAGSVAAPTAGLHFTPALLDRVLSAGVERSDVTLHVGAGTFKPVQAEHVEDHPIHAEWCRVEPGTIRALESTRAAGGRVIPVGTTAVRTLESLPHPLTEGARSHGVESRTRLLITPGFTFRWTDALITNFHLPRSTLLALVVALFPGGVAEVIGHYREAMERGYRFFSYGDAMLILP